MGVDDHIMISRKLCTSWFIHLAATTAAITSPRSSSSLEVFIHKCFPRPRTKANKRYKRRESMICDLWNRLLAGEERTWAVNAGAADSALLLTRHVRPHPQSRYVCLVNTLWFSFSLVFSLIPCLSGSGVVSLSLGWLGFVYKRCLEKCWPISSPYDNRERSATASESNSLNG